jgi:hypothetical protein
MQKDSSPTIQGLKVRAVRVPMTEPHKTASIGLANARRDEDWRRKRLAQGSDTRTRKKYPCIQPSLARDQHASPVLHADSALAGVC